MRATSEGYLPSTRSHVRAIEKMDRKGKMCSCAICHKIQEEEKEEIGVRLGKLRGRKDYRKAVGVRTWDWTIFVRIIASKIFRSRELNP